MKEKDFEVYGKIVAALLWRLGRVVVVNGLVAAVH